ncbi:MAG: MoaD/ThiS family protein [Pyrodictiaceae archaeon]
MTVKARIELYGRLSELYGDRLEIELASEPSVEELLSALSKRIPEAISANGSPKPGVLVFINGVDVRILDKSERLGENILVEIIQVFHGG